MINPNVLEDAFREFSETYLNGSMTALFMSI